MRNLIILGVDPGTTVGYAALDLGGRLVKVRSSKALDLNSLVAEVIELGRVVAVGTDKKHCPDFVEKTAIKLGAKLIVPKEDLLTEEKERLARTVRLEDGHQVDAFASAHHAYKILRSLIKKIIITLKKHGKAELLNGVTALVITKDISIKKALSMLEPKMVEGKEEVREELGYDALIKRYEELRKKNQIIRRENERLREYLTKLKELRPETRTIIKKASNKKLAQLLGYREQRILVLEKQLVEEKEKQEQLMKELNLLRQFLADLKDKIIVKKLANLGIKEFENKDKILQIKEGDIILVDDPNIVSEEVIERLKNNLIITKQAPGKELQQKLDIILAKNLWLIENECFGIVKREEFEREKNKKGILERVIGSYKSDRN